MTWKIACACAEGQNSQNFLHAVKALFTWLWCQLVHQGFSGYPTKHDGYVFCWCPSAPLSRLSYQEGISHSQSSPVAALTCSRTLAKGVSHDSHIFCGCWQQHVSFTVRKTLSPFISSLSLLSCQFSVNIRCAAAEGGMYECT